MIRQEYQTLWERIEHFNIDDPASSIKYSDKLSFSKHWSKEYTERVITEYKKFIFLCCALPNGASPSPAVDDAWHLHLTYTINYWKEFCKETLGKEIHHHPSKGGASEQSKYRDWYRKTLDDYQFFFGYDPPEDIWPPPSSATTVVNTEPDENEKVNSFRGLHFILCLLPAFFVPFFYSKTNPFQLTSEQFLVFYIILIIATIVALVLLYQYKKNWVLSKIDRSVLSKCNVFQVSRFIYGSNRSLQTSVVDLVSREILVPEMDGLFYFQSPGYSYSGKEPNPLLANLQKNFKTGDRLTMVDLSKHYNDELSFDDDLARLFQKVNQKDYSGFILVGVVLLFGLTRLIQGVINDRPVGYMFGLILLVLIAGLIGVSSMSYQSVLQNQFKWYYESYQLPGPVSGNAEPAWNFMFFGLAAAGGIYAVDHLQTSFKDHFKRESASGGCGSSGCGSSCGGDGGGGGGGCGGCGGGD